MRISDWSSDVCSSDLVEDQRPFGRGLEHVHHRLAHLDREIEFGGREGLRRIFEMPVGIGLLRGFVAQHLDAVDRDLTNLVAAHAERSEEHTSELQSLMRNSYAVFCLKKKTKQSYYNTTLNTI